MKTNNANRSAETIDRSLVQMLVVEDSRTQEAKLAHILDASGTRSRSHAMAGIQCMEAILRFDPAARISGASGLSSGPAEAKASHKGARGFIRKPFNSKEFLTAVSRVLAEDYGRTPNFRADRV